MIHRLFRLAHNNAQTHILSLILSFISLSLFLSLFLSSFLSLTQTSSHPHTLSHTQLEAHIMHTNTHSYTFTHCPSVSLTYSFPLSLFPFQSKYFLRRQMLPISFFVNKVDDDERNSKLRIVNLLKIIILVHNFRLP